MEKKEGVFYYFTDVKKLRNTSFSFPASDATLTPKIVKKFKMSPALERFAKALYKQCRSTDNTVVGIEIKGISFILLYDPDKKKEVNPQ